MKILLNGSQLLTLDRRITAVGYALAAASAPLPPGALLASMLPQDPALLGSGCGLVMTVPAPPWVNGSSSGAPYARSGHSAVWDGQHMIVWGGTVAEASPVASGAMYRPESDSWAAINTADAPEARSGHTAVWAGTQMIVWGGVGNSGPLGTGGRFEPATQTWTPVTTTGAPPERKGHCAVWTGNAMLIWGGKHGGFALGDGAAYAPQTDTWTALASAAAPPARFDHAAVWTGNEMLVVAGSDASADLSSSAAYDPTARQWRALSGAGGLLARREPAAVWTGAEPFKYTLHASRQDEFLMLRSKKMPAWLKASGLAIEGRPTSDDVTSPDIAIELVVEDLYDHTRVTNDLTLAVVATGTVQTQAGLSLSSTNQYTDTIVTFTNRPPFLAASPQPSNSFTMRYYYKTEPSFHWPGLASPPPAGSIVPYLRPKDPETGEFVGDPDSKTTESLAIVYRPVWPVRDPKDGSKPLPTLSFSATLAGPKAGLPGVRDMLTAQVLYQQSIAQDLTVKTPSVVLHDPTRQKLADLDAHNLDALPGGVYTDYYLGQFYFPNLPPHVAERVSFDPNRGAKGSLVIEGEYIRETLGESYLLLNVLRDSDLAVVKDLCPAGDADKSKWDALVDALATYVETFHESTTQPGAYEPDPAKTVIVGVQDLAEIGDANIAVDSYALSATGPGSGYVTLVESSGTAFTQPGDYTEGEHYIEFDIGPHGFFDKPSDWTSHRAAPGKIQQAISDYIMAHTRLRQALNDSQGAKNDLDKAIRHFEGFCTVTDEIYDYQEDILKAEEALQWAKFAYDTWEKISECTKEDIKLTTDALTSGLPRSTIIGLSTGGDLTSAARTALKATGFAVVTTYEKLKIAKHIVMNALENAVNSSKRWMEWNEVGDREYDLKKREMALALGNQLSAMQGRLWTINERLRQLDDAARAKQALIAEGDRLQQERLVFRQRAAAVVQGYRTRDAAFRLFRNEKLERYKTLFDLAARYALLAANAYDYETGLLSTTAGRRFVNRIINARALGVVRSGEPQYAGSNTGDPGLSSALAEMKADWDVLRSRLGFTNPDAYGTTVSLRTEAYRILPTPDGDPNWVDALHAARLDNVLADQDVRRYCMQLDAGDDLPVPGLVLTFSTTIADGHNLFGRPLAAGDHAFSPSSFATKIFGVGVALIGYRGMDNPAANSGVGGVSPNDPDVWYLDPLALSATPYVYLIPVGVDSMRTPPLGDASDIRTWCVEDLAIPLPFNIGDSAFSTERLWQSGDSLTEPLFAPRKHQAFRPVSATACFSPSLYSSAGTLQRSQYTSNRLVARSVWNSHWKLVIPGKTLLSHPKEGLDRFIQTVTDVQLHFVTYSYSGN